MIDQYFLYKSLQTKIWAIIQTARVTTIHGGYPKILLRVIRSYCLASLHWCCKDLICVTLADEDAPRKLVDAVAGVKVGFGGKVKTERWVAS